MDTGSKFWSLHRLLFTTYSYRKSCLGFNRFWTYFFPNIWCCGLVWRVSGVLFFIGCADSWGFLACWGGSWLLDHLCTFFRCLVCMFLLPIAGYFFLFFFQVKFLDLCFIHVSPVLFVCILLILIDWLTCNFASTNLEDWLDSTN